MWILIEKTGEQNYNGFMKATAELNWQDHRLVSQVYAIRGKTEVTSVERIQENCERLGIPFAWVNKAVRASIIQDYKGGNKL